MVTASLSSNGLATTHSRGVGRPAGRKNGIVDALRNQIVEGHFVPGQRLPLRTEIERDFGASPTTVQRALDKLAADGFIQARGSLGTFVTDAPPHLHRYAVIFPEHPSQTQQWRQFWTALSNESYHITQQSEERQLRVYHGIKGHTDHKEYLDLIAEVQAHRLAGLIFAIDPDPFVDTPILDEPNLPRVAITSRSLPDVSAVRLDSFSFVDKALDYLRERGCKRVAIIAHPGWRGEVSQHFVEGLRARGLETRPYWMHQIDIDVPEEAQFCAHLLFHSHAVEAFDALIIADDNLVEHAARGIEAANLATNNVTFVAHGNFPLAPQAAPTSVVMRRLGYDAHQVMRLCTDLIDRQRRGETVPAVSSVEAIWQKSVVG